MKREFVFGSTGMLGRYVEDYLSSFYDCIPINRKNFDAENNNFSDLKKVLAPYSVNTNDVLINCIGLLPHRFNKDSLSKEGYSDKAYKKFILVNSI